jgi:hypothetical protein
VLREIEIWQVQNGYISGAEGNRGKDRIVAISMIEYRGPILFAKWPVTQRTTREEEKQDIAT